MNLAENPVCVRVKTETGSHIEPPLEQDWSDLEKLRWLAGCIKADCGIDIKVTPTTHRRGRFMLSTKTCGVGDQAFYEAWRYMNGMQHGAEASRA